MHRKAIYWAPAILWAGLIFVFSSLSFPPGPDLFPAQDKVMHTILFGTLAGFIFLGFRVERQFSFRKAALLAVLLTSLYGAFDEFHQYFTPNRNSDAMDWTADTVGGVLFVAGWNLCSRKMPKR
ncbi:MAG: hypothetical protein A2X46_02350 [Lentisphaerae bacterium GWF2_57_35]|nr:MAG: hypothetical protein A2X46_02350 [Lentisphaerae bacterium GWF2_57_35]